MPGAYVLRTVHVFIQSHLKRHTASCRPVSRLRRAFQRTLIRLLPTVQGVMADLWPCWQQALLSSCCATSQMRLKLLCRQQAAIIHSSPRVWKEGDNCGWGWGEVKKSQDKPLFDTFLQKSMAVMCAPWRKDTNHTEEERLSSSEYHEDVTFLVMWLSNK